MEKKNQISQPKKPFAFMGKPEDAFEVLLVAFYGVTFIFQE